MTRRSLLPILVALAMPLAAAGYGEGSHLEADAPVVLTGRVDSLFTNGMVAFTGEPTGVPPTLTLSAPVMHFLVRTYAQPCGGAPSPASLPGACTPGAPGEPDDEEIELTDARVSVTRALTPYKVLVTNDRAYADTPAFGDNGRIYATTAQNNAIGSTTGTALSYSPSSEGWEQSGEHVGEPVYFAEVPNVHASATGGIVQAQGGLETFLQGVVVNVQGTRDGQPFSKSYETPFPKDPSQPFRVVVIESSGSSLAAAAPGAFDAFAHASTQPMWDVRSTAKFTGATGTVVTDGGREEHSLANVDLQGPLSLKLVKITGGDAPRLQFDVKDGLQIAKADTPADDEPIPPEALAAAGAAGAGGAGALFALLYFWPRFKYWMTLFLLPMYTRIERDAVLEHEKRDELYELIRVAPGIHAHEIGEKAHIGWGTTVYHLKLLENHGLIVSKKSGRYKRFFVNTGEYTKKKDVYGALRNTTAKAVADYVVNHPGTTQKELCAALGIQPSLASWHVEKLEGVDLVKRVKDGRMVRYFAGPAWSDLNVRVDPLTGGADTPVET